MKPRIVLEMDGAWVLFMQIWAVPPGPHGYSWYSTARSFSRWTDAISALAAFYAKGMVKRGNMTGAQ